MDRAGTFGTGVDLALAPQRLSRWAIVFLVSLAFAVLAYAPVAQAGPYVAPPGAPPVAAPVPATPAIGSQFVPPPFVASTVPTPVTTIWEIGICRFGPGAWVADDPAVIQNGIGRDVLRFRLCLNFVPSSGGSVYVVFGANPWGFPPEVSVPVGQAPFALGGSSYIPIDIPEPPPLGTWAFLVVLTTPGGTVLDVLDPVLVTGTTLAPTVHHHRQGQPHPPHPPPH